MDYPESCKSYNCGKIVCPQDCQHIDDLWKFKINHQCNEKAEYAFDNSYNPPILDIYCGRCGAFVCNIGSLNKLPLKTELLCSECQDALDSQS